LQPGEVYRWHKGTCLQATETSSFIIPGAVFENGIPMGETLELSDDEHTKEFVVVNTGNK